MTYSCFFMGGCRRLVRCALNPRGRIAATVVLAVAVLAVGAVAASAQFPSDPEFDSVPTQTDLNPPPPPPPPLITPNDGTGCLETAVCLDWGDTAGAVTYDVQIGTSCGVGPSYDTVVSDYCPPGLAAGTLYYWRVRAKDAFDQWGEWTQCSSLTTLPDPLPPPALASPVNGAVCQLLNVCFDWDDLAGAVAYEIQIGLDCDTGTTYPTSSSNYCPPDFDLGTTYYWKVRGQDVCDQWGAWSDCWSFTTLPVPLPAPTLELPVDGADCQLLDVCLEWDDVTGAASYEVQVGTSCGIGDHYTSVDSEFCDPLLAVDTIYFWRVRAKDDCGQWGAWSGCLSFTTVPSPPGFALLLSPPDTETCVDTGVCLDWDDVSGAVAYEVQIGTTCGTGPAYGTGNSDFCPPGLSGGTTYFWRVRAQGDECGVWGSWTDCFSFTTSPDTPAPPAHLTPVDAATCQATDVCLDWANVAGAVGYEVRVGESCGAGSAIAAPSSDYCPPGLVAGTTYYWQVRVEVACGVWSDWSTCWSFTTLPDPPATPTHVSPTDAATCQILGVCLEWDDVPGATGYELQVGTSCGAGPVYPTAVSGHCPPGLLLDTTYHWRMRAKDACDQWSGWSGCWSFTTVPDVPAVPVHVSPADAATCQALDVCLDWGDVLGAVRYELQIGTTCGSGGATYTTVGSDTCPLGLLPDTTYHWRMRAKDACDQWSDWSECWWFETAPEALGPPTLATPADEADCVAVDECLDWDDVTGAVGYEVHLGSDCDTGTTYPTVNSEYCPASDLAFETVYYWKVRAEDRCGQWSDWSECWWFETAPEPLTAPTLATPADEADCQAVDVCLDWGDVTGAVGYEVHLGSGCDTGTTYPAAGSDYCPASDLAFETVYYWKVRVQDACGEWSAWSECWWFETAPEPLTAPTLLLPVDDGALAQPVEVCMDWEDVSGAVGYEIQLDLDCGIGPIYPTGDSDFCPPADLACWTTYYWSVRAQDVCGYWSAWSDCWSFVTGCCIPPDWSVHPPDYLYTGTITAEVLLDDLPVTGPDDLLAAFFGCECRGVAPAWEAPGGEFLFLLTVYSNAPSGEHLTFKYFNEETCEVHLVCDEIEFVSDMELGTIPAPYPMDITDVCVSREFVTGWNWFSLNVYDEDMSLNTVLASLGDNGLYIKDQFDFAEYVLPWGWFGSLESITCSSSYLIRMDAPDLLEFCGCPCDPETVIPLVEGWNWPGYIPQVPMVTDDALTSLDDNGIIIKNQTSYAEYVPPWGWIGTLTMMVPLDGFKIDMANPDDLVYPAVMAARTTPEDVAASGALQDESERLDGWTADPSGFSANGTVTASVTIEGEPVVSSGDMLGAFAGRACRGVTEATMLPTGDYVFFLVVHGDGEEAIEFRFFDASEDEILEVEEVVVFEPDMIRGRALAPYPMTVGATGAGSDDELVPTATALYGNHPNPFRGGTVVRYSLKDAGHVAIEVYNLKGERVRALVDARREPGTYLVDWDGRDSSGAAVSSGVYFCRMATEGYTTTSQMVLIK